MNRKFGKVKSKMGIGLGVFLMLLIAAVGSASAADCSDAIGGPGSCNCGDTVVGDYTLDGDMICSGLTDGLIIGADGIMIDGAGYSITGDGSAWTSGILNSGVLGQDYGYSDVTINDLTVSGFQDGIHIEGKFMGGTTCLNCVERNTVSNCVAHDNVDGYGIYFASCVRNSTIDHCTAYNTVGTLTSNCDDPGAGIKLFGKSHYNDVTNNLVYNNDLAGIYSKKGCQHNYVADNTVYDNGKVDPEAEYTGGIRFQCKTTHFNTFEDNVITDSIGPGIFIGGNDCVVRGNTVTGSMQANTNNLGDGIWNDRHPGGGQNTLLEDNIFCDNENLDINVQNAAQGVTGDENTCDTTSNYNDDGTTGCTYSCFKIAGTASKDGNPVDLNKVDISNLEYTDKKWSAKIDGNYYELFIGALNDPQGLNPDISPDEELLIVGCEEISGDESNCNVTDHMVTSGDIAVGGITKDLILNHYCLNWDTYPYSTWEDPDWSGPAAMEMMINHYTTAPSQSDLDTEGRGNNHECNSALPYVDRYGMRATLNAHLYPDFAHYGNHITTDVENALHYICWWQSLGPGAVPAYQDYSNWMVVRGIHTDINPRDGSYSGPDYGYTIYGYWINAPDPAGIGENSYKCVEQFTENYYKAMLDQCDVTDGNWVSICEPPEVDAEITLADSPVRFADAITPVIAEKMLMVYDAEQLALEKAVKNDELLKIVEAAINGVNEQLIPYDTQFAEVIAMTVPGEPMLVAGDSGDYYLVPFNVHVEEKMIKKVPVKIEKVKTEGLRKLERLERVAENVIIEPIARELIKVERTLVVVLVDAEDGSFKEASWVDDPVKYLPVSKVWALKLALCEISITDKEDLKTLTSKPTIELVYRDASPYYPDWKITVNDQVFYVSQDGMVSQA